MVSNEIIMKLQLVNGFGRKSVYRVIKYIEDNNITVNSFSDIFKMFQEAGVKRVKINLEQVEEEYLKIMKLCKKSNIYIISIYDDAYPVKLQSIEDKPLILYIDGNTDILNQYNNIAIVGARAPSQKGYEISSILAEKLTDEDCNIISGFATGCDEAAHRGCLLAGGKTVAVIPSGHHCIYPRSHKSLYNEIIFNNGAIISELPPNAKPEKNTFVDRNRIIAALSEGIIIIEGGANGGTSHTINFGKMYNKELAYTRIDNIGYSQMSINQDGTICNNEVSIINSFEELLNFKEKALNKCKCMNV